MHLAISPGGASDAPVASISDGSASVKFGWPDRLPQAVIDGATATYPEVFPGVDLVAKAGLEGVETFLVVKTREAAQNPAVRSWSMPMTWSSGLAVKAHDNGAKSLVDEAGVERVRVPAALMWDSTGKEAASGAEDLLAESADTRTAPVATQMVASRLTAVPQTSFLDDPATVYPVVIDPSANLGQTHVLRVTDDWSKWDGAVGDHGKVGYNGWSSPYYRSRMLYQFAWRKNSDGSFVRPSQIAKAEFQYKQDHSPQHSPCDSRSTAYPAVHAKLANTINSSDTWSDRTGNAWHPWAKATSYLAVGHEDVCNKVVTETWNLTGSVLSERQPQSQGGYDYRTTITVGLFSDDEGDKMGWKHYINDGASPKFVLTYQQEPQVPAAADFSVTPRAGTQTSPWVTTTTTPTLSTNVRLEGSYACPTTAANCVRAVFTLTKGSSTITLNGNAVASGSVSTATVAAPLSVGEYTVTMRAENSATGLVSAWSAGVGLKVDPSPKAPSWSWVSTAWPNAPKIPPSTPLAITATPNAADGDVFQLCALVTSDGATEQYCSPLSGTPLTGPTSISLPGLSTGAYTVTVAARDESSLGSPTADSPVQRTVGF